MSEIDFESDDPAFIAEIIHRKGDGVFNRAFNAKDENAALEKAIQLFEESGLNPVFIEEINVIQLEKPDGE